MISHDSPIVAGPERVEVKLSAKPIYGVTLKLGIIRYEGEWDSNETKFPDIETALAESGSLEYMRAFFNRLLKERKVRP